MMAYGNEPAGPNSGKWLQDYVARWKENDKRRFWTTAAGWPRMPGSDFHTRIVARQMRASLLAYLGSGEFKPKLSISSADLEELVPTIPTLRKFGAKITASSEEEGFPTKNLLDGIGETIWHKEYLKRQPSPPHELTINLPRASSIRAVLLPQRRDGEASGQIAEFEILDDGGRSLVRSGLPKDIANFRIALPPSTILKSFVIRVQKAHSGPFGSLAGLDVELGK